MKKIINKKEDYIIEMLEGISRTSNNIDFDKEKFFVFNNKHDKNKVALISGGGAGHEPAHAGYVGKGMLAAAVSGHVFSSPTPDQIQEAINKVNANETLLIIKNYTGDVMNFKIAAELANAEGKKVDFVIVDDDIAVENSTWTEGKRGVAGTVLVHKIAGAAAESGKSLAEVKAIAEKVIKNIKTIGMALEAGTNPSDGKKSFELPDSKMEFGVGIHGEPGIAKEDILPSKELVNKMLTKILDSYDFKSSEVAVLVNGMGGTALSELYIATNDLYNNLESKGINIYKTIVGNYMTSLDMKGFSITLLKLDDEMKKLLNANVETLGFN